MTHFPTSDSGGADASEPGGAVQVVHLDSGPLHYQVRGEGRALLCLHPAGDVRGTWPLERLSERFRVFVPVLSGLDGTPTSAAIDSMPQLAHRLGEFIDRVIGERCDVVGRASGAALACWLALVRPQRIGQLVLESPSIGTDAALQARLGEVEPLTLIVHGSADRLVPAANVQSLRARIRHSYLTYVHEAAHDIGLDQPERLHRLVESFLLRAEAFMVNWSAATPR